MKYFLTFAYHTIQTSVIQTIIIQISEKSYKKLAKFEDLVKKN